MNLSAETRRRLRHVHGYIGLEMFRAAAAELAAIAVGERQAPEVRLTRMDFYIAASRWESAVRIGATLARKDPSCEQAWIGWAYALRELQRVTEAKEVLLVAEAAHGVTSALVHYNLACYDALLGDLAEARARLVKAYRLDKTLKETAEHDPDLAALRAADAKRRAGDPAEGA
jgi:tetratricopeptide (TPR) repeat protein